MQRNGYLWTSGVNLDTAVQLAHPDFLQQCKISDLATISVDFCILYAECLPYFYFRFVWPTDVESIPHASNPTSIIPTKFEVNMSIHCRVIAFLSADTSRDLVTLTFDLLTLSSCPAWRVGGSRAQPCHQVLKTLRLSVLELWVITFPVGYHWKCVRVHCACAESLCNFYWAPTTIKGRLLSSRPLLKLFSDEKTLSSVETGLQNGGFGENGDPNLRY